MRGLDRDRHLVVGVRERGAPHRGGAGGDDLVEQPPAVELDHAAAHQRVGGQGVGAVAAAVDDEHVETARARSMAVAAPAARAPTTTTSWREVGWSWRILSAQRWLALARRLAAGDVSGHEGRVVADAVDEVGVAAVLEALAET